MQNVTKLAVVNKQKSAPKTNRAFAKRMKRQAMAGVGIGAVALSLIGLSLTHIATGVDIVTNSGTVQSSLMAVGIECGYISLEVANLMVATEKLNKKIGKFTGPGIITTMLWSAALNAFAFAHEVTGWERWVAIGLGASIPVMIYALCRVAADLYIDCDSRK